MPTWTADQIPDMRGKTVVITGASSGLGYESALALARKGAAVVLASRPRKRGRRALEALRQAAPAAEVSFRELDLASLDSIRAFAARFQDEHERLDILMNNAAQSAPPRRLTQDGFEMQFGVNHLGHFALTGLLLDTLLATPGSRVVVLGSRMHAVGRLDWDDLMSERRYSRWRAYGRSKLANLLFCFELQRRLEAAGAGVSAIAAHPGQAATNWYGNQGPILRYFLALLSPLFQPSAAEGALPQLYAAASPDARPGAYYGPARGSSGRPIEVQASRAAYVEADARRLWELSESLTGVTYDGLKR